MTERDFRSAASHQPKVPSAWPQVINEEGGLRIENGTQPVLGLGPWDGSAALTRGASSILHFGPNRAPAGAEPICLLGNGNRRALAAVEDPQQVS